MFSQVSNQHQFISEKRILLESSASILKEEFIGLNTVIDRIIESISAWYLFPNMQMRPVIVNLWGMTGVGKTALVKRLIELLDMKKQFYRFDLGQKSNNEWVIKNNLIKVFDCYANQPNILVFDEFQHARTLDGNGDEAEQVSSRIVWEILDSGTFTAIGSSQEYLEVNKLANRLDSLLEKGLQVVDGVVKTDRTRLLQEFSSTNNMYQSLLIDDSQPLYFVPRYFVKTIYEVGRSLFKSVSDVHIQLDQLDGLGTVHFLRKILDSAELEKTIDCRKSLIFVIGNLDDVYHMTGSVSADIDADDFHQESLKITVSEIKNALGNRFRAEQIARLGNTHIIYPAISKESYQKIIEKELLSICYRMKLEIGIDINFDKSVADVIYKEAVFPAQGVRPIFTTINTMISSTLGKLAEKIFSIDSKPKEIHARVIDNQLCYNSGINLLLRLPLHLVLEELRKPKCNDLQAIIAVHESGHAIIEMAMFGSIPSYIFSVTADANAKGMVSSSPRSNYHSRQDMILECAFMLGGYAAEEMMFGRDLVTSGAANDISKATTFVGRLLRLAGLGSFQAIILPEQKENSFTYFDRSGQTNDEILDILTRGMKQAKKILKREKLLLEKMSLYLSDHTMLSKIKINEMTCKYGSKYLTKRLISNESTGIYRRMLHSK